MMRECFEDEKVGLCGQDLLLMFPMKKEKGKEAGLEGTGKKRSR